MKKLALSLFLVLNVCATEPAFAMHGHVDVKPVQWYLLYVWQSPSGDHVLNPKSVKRRFPQTFDSRKKCEGAGRMVAENLNEKYSGYARPVAIPVCIAARTKFEMRRHLRQLDLNFGGQPA